MFVRKMNVRLVAAALGTFGGMCLKLSPIGRATRVQSTRLFSGGFGQDMLVCPSPNLLSVHLSIVHHDHYCNHSYPCNQLGLLNGRVSPPSLLLPPRRQVLDKSP